MIRILLADDHVALRRSLSLMLLGEPDMSVVAEAGNGVEVLRQLQAVQCDVVLLDISMPGLNGIQALDEIRALHPKLPVLILSLFREPQYISHVLQAGAAGYVFKERASEDLAAAIRSVWAGGRFLPPDLEHD